MRIFLTGGTGFIGSHFINQAHAAGHDLVCLRRTPASRPRIPLEREPTWLEAALDNIPDHAFAGCDILVHLAAHTPNVPYDTLSACSYWNVFATVKMLEQAHAAGIRRWVVAGSCFEYGLSGETCEFIPPDAPLKPTMTYPASKAAASVAVEALARHLGADLWYGRIFQVFGEGEAQNRFWPSLRRAALAGEDFPMTEGGQVRDFIPVEDVAARFLAEARRMASPGAPAGIRIENVGTGRPQTLRQFAEYWWRKWNATGRLLFGAVPYRKNEVMRYVPRI